MDRVMTHETHFTFQGASERNFNVISRIATAITADGQFEESHDRFLAIQRGKVISLFDAAGVHAIEDVLDEARTFAGLEDVRFADSAPFAAVIMKIIEQIGFFVTVTNDSQSIQRDLFEMVQRVTDLFSHATSNDRTSGLEDGISSGLRAFDERINDMNMISKHPRVCLTKCLQTTGVGCGFCHGRRAGSGAAGADSIPGRTNGEVTRRSSAAAGRRKDRGTRSGGQHEGFEKYVGGFSALDTTLFLSFRRL
jgi:hypothetical protein